MSREERLAAVYDRLAVAHDQQRGAGHASVVSLHQGIHALHAASGGASGKEGEHQQDRCGAHAAIVAIKWDCGDFLASAFLTCARSPRYGPRRGWHR